MKYKNLQKNKVCPSKLERKRGFVVLFAVTISAILLSIALGIANIALKEITFGTSAKDTNEAFFAADTGIECALNNDKLTGSLFVHPSNPSISCNSATISTLENPSSYWSFVVSGLNNSGQGCAKVTIEKTASSLVTIISKGYNKGGGVSGLCTIGLNSIEREIKVSYGGGSALPPPPPPSTWYATGGTWNYRKAITIDYTKVSNTDQSDFPVLVSLITDSNLVSGAQGDGDDILFTSADKTTKLFHEIEKYNSTTGELIAWVKIPTLSSTVDTVIYMYYGNASATDQADSTNVWDANYSAVWHLPNGTTLGALDSTSNANNGTITGPTATAGKIDGAANYDGATSRFISTPRINMPTGNSDYTTSVWVYLNPSSIKRKIFSYGAAANYQFYGLGITSSDYVEIGHWANDWTSTVLIPENTWTHITNVYTGSNRTDSIYINGTFVQSHVGLANNNLVATNSYIGRYFTSAESSWIGKIDDLRFSKTTRSVDWIKTEYNNQLTPSTFYKSIGAQETP